MPETELRALPGKPLPFGAEARLDGVNFSLFSRNATAVTLLLYQDANAEKPQYEFKLDPKTQRTGDVWHVFILGLKPGALYLYRADGPYKPEDGQRFNPNKVLMDPYAKALTGDFIWNTDHALGYDPHSTKVDLSFSREADDAYVPKGIVVDDSFDWQGDRPLNYPLRDSIIYETHIRGLSMSQSSGVVHPGTYRGVIESIQYLSDLGVSSLEFLPLHEFDELDNPRKNPKTKERLHNYWGYSTIAFFAPKASYSSAGARGEQVREFKEMVRELHKAGLEVILDIVFNHTAEGNERGPTLSFRGLDNSIYYMLDDNKRYYKNFSGCGNTLNCNHPVMRSLILDCLRYWVVDMHVDGFRFDLGSILGRDQRGNLLENPPIIERIAEDPILRSTKVIAEAWDAGGAYQVGSFPGGRWAEWNDRFRDDVRKFWRGDDRCARSLATRLTGSSDLYLSDGRKPFHSVNYITCHDGFTLNDLVTYNGKHNEANGESNRDGNDSNFSYNYGFEGPITNLIIERVRNRQVKNFLATLFLSLGTPMLLGGDEFRRSQDGNNNAYCQNNAVSWYDWGLLKRHADIHSFTKALIKFRKSHRVFLRSDFYTGGASSKECPPDIIWFDEKGQTPNWETQNRFLACRIDGRIPGHPRDDNDFFIVLNSNNEAVNYMLPLPLDKGQWHKKIDTGMDAPGDFLEDGREIPLKSGIQSIKPRSFMLLLTI